MPLALTLVGAAFPPERRGSAMGALQGLTGLAVGGGPVIGGAIADGLAWQWIFWVNVPIGLLAVPFVLAPDPGVARQRPALDLPGLILITLAAFGIVWGLVRGNAAGWGSAETLGSIAAGALALGAFVVHERAHAHADAAARAVRAPRLRGRQRRRLPDDRRALQRGLLLRPVPADRARARPARRRPAPAAVDGDAVLRRPGRRRARRPPRRAPVPGHRAHAAGRRLRLHRAGRPGRTWRWCPR